MNKFIFAVVFCTVVMLFCTYPFGVCGGYAPGTPKVEMYVNNHQEVFILQTSRLFML